MRYEKADLLAGLFSFNAAGKSFDINYAHFVDAARDQFVFIMGFHLKCDDGSFAVNDSCPARDLFAQRSCRQMLNVDVHADGALAFVEQWQHRLAGRML